ncbi:MAG: excalibur calcium-binding domain-containing protein, partial [Psychrosphaera sp.]|nr:excalibur calcium-binding domain-containing protein [Psychrosphaera sp.]
VRTPVRAPVIREDFSGFSCQGKQHCGQMTSCKEARFYLKNCPNMKVDGDRDGVACERQWC